MLFFSVLQKKKKDYKNVKQRSILHTYLFDCNC